MAERISGNSELQPCRLAVIYPSAGSSVPFVYVVATQARQPSTIEAHGALLSQHQWYLPQFGIDKEPPRNLP